ncbi:MAG: DUF4136 domain-containing protein [Ramlibacter sp.]|nr:DUF4136 domain-containing protein [Ramlibacter sp.]
MKFSLGIACAAAVLLSGCATGYLLDNNVQSFSNLTALPAQPTYRFERLPSQQDPAQVQLEAMADGALHSAGLRRDDANPRYSVQVGAQVQRVLSPWSNPWEGWGGIGIGHRGVGLGFGFPFGRLESPWYQRDVALIIRELPSNRPVYETRAANAGPWVDNRTALPAMFHAALQGFPTPPAGPRRVDLQIGR